MEANNIGIVRGDGVTSGTITGGSLLPQTYPNVCPGCGRCRVCGHGAGPTPYNPTPYSPSYPQITCANNASETC